MQTKTIYFCYEESLCGLGGGLQLMAEGFYSHYSSLHHTPLSDINFDLLLFSTVSNQSVRNFACRRGLLISLSDRQFFLDWLKISTLVSRISVQARISVQGGILTKIK